MFLLDEACKPLYEVFGFGTYQVGTSATRGEFRDVDVRLILKDKQFDALKKAIGRNGVSFLGLAIGEYLAARTNGLPIDFQIQRMTEANLLHDGIRNPLGHRTLENYKGDAIAPSAPVGDESE